MYFAKRYVDANNTAFQDVDSCHTLTCAIMLLNTDLHDSKIQSKMTLTEFVENLKGLNNGSNFTDALLESLYSAIKSEPLECASLENEDVGDGAAGMVNGSCNLAMRPIGSNPFLQVSYWIHFIEKTFFLSTFTLTNKRQVHPYFNNLK